MNLLPVPAPERIGLFGGSFDPVHHGHLIMAREALEQLGLSRVIWIPAARSPFKLDSPPAPADARLEMVRAAIRDEPGFECDDLELRREGPSFSIDTAREMRRRHPSAELYYFIGDDNVPDLEKWKEITALRELVRFVVLSRGSGDTGGLPVIRREIDISSTEVRNRVAAGKSVRYLLPEASWRILHSNGLYAGD